MTERIGFLHLSGARSGETDTLVVFPAHVGSEAGIQIVVPGAAPRHCVLTRKGSDIVLQDCGESETLLAGEPVREAVLRDGDIVELGPGGPKLRFRHEGAPPVSLLQTLRRPLPSLRLGPIDVLRAVRMGLSHTSLAFRFTLLGALAVGMMLFGFGWNESRRVQQEIKGLQEAVRQAQRERALFQDRIEQERERAEAERRSLETRIEDFRVREDTLNRQLAEASSGQVQTLKDELLKTRGRLETLEGERAAGERIIRDYGAGVCLIQGAFAYYDSAGRPLRYRTDESGKTVRNAEGHPEYDVEGAGPIHTISYFGTAFLVDRRGLVLTNRHVAEPWWNDALAESLAAAGFKPRFTLFRAFFPREKEPFELELVGRSEKFDLALLRVDMRGGKVPVLPLDGSGDGAVAGQPVVVLGYPTGLEAILAKADSQVVQEILKAHGTNSERVSEALSHKGLIRPSTTQGHIGDITQTDIVFDAPTTQGGSGGPVFNKNGRVIAVEYAVLPKFGGNSFGIPIGYAVELIAAHKAPKKKA